MIIYLSRLSCILYAVLLINSCKIHVKAHYIEDDKKSAEGEIEKFHFRFSTEKYDSIYDNSSSSFQKSLNKVDAISAMKVSHDDCGQFDSVIDKRINVIIGAPVQIRAVYISKYSKKVFTEVFIFVEEDDEIKLLDYEKINHIVQLPPVL